MDLVVKHPAIYFAFLRGRPGELEALRNLSPLARARTIPVVDLPTADSKTGTQLEQYVAEFVHELATSWGVNSPLYIDLARYGPDRVDTKGRHIVEHLFHCARQLKVWAIPVTGPLAERDDGLGGTGYVSAISRIVSSDGRGAAVRMPYEDFGDADILDRNVDDALSWLAIEPEQVDLIFDAASLPHMQGEGGSLRSLLATLTEALRVVEDRRFRSIVFAASSVPESLAPPKDGGPLIFERVEYQVWKELIQRVARPFVRFGDYAIWNSRLPDSGSEGIAPARVRFPMGERQVFFHSSARYYRSLSQSALKFPGVRELPDSWGLSVVRHCAAKGGDPGNARGWVARDTNVHIETAVRDVEQHLMRSGRLREVGEARVRPAPWLQNSFIESLEDES